ncbi:tetratricopeptide repeat protein [uncultured Pelagimonas sp.]|uniref:tetratricopeptide repeat protein n=1 Tax=uncultured Pelagimonas sp. TaxID=1618102 RepID=UPI0026110E30|nr:tetratricopeptide repeat protein [uncultured Pelagimonas sp.]
MTRYLTTASLLGLFGISGYMLLAILAGSPAFNATLREDNVFGVSQLRFSAPMYDRPAYLFQIGTSYLRADLVLSTGEGGDDLGLASMETALERATQAVSYFERSLALAPGDAHVWTSLAWAHTLLNETDEARVALAHSWELAPFHQQLAGRRLDLADVLYAWDTPELTIKPTEKETRSLDRDRALLERNGRAPF